MDLDDRFHNLSAPERLAVAAAAAQRVLPIFLATSSLDATALRDGIDIVTLAARGRDFSQVEFTRAINAVTALAAGSSDNADKAVCTTVVCALEAASHNPAAVLDCLAAARRAVAAIAGEDGASEELAWQQWATRRASQTGFDGRSFALPDAPTTTWQLTLQDDLPLFERKP